MYTPRRKRKPSKGFTLIEVVLVVFIIGLVLAGGVALSSGSIGYAKMDAFAVRLSSFLVQARGVAISRGKWVFVTYDLIDQSYWTSVASGAPGHAPLETKRIRPPNGIRIEDVAVGSSTAPDGIHDVGSVVIEISPAGTMTGHLVHIRGADGERALTVEAHPITGAVSIHRGYVTQSDLELLTAS